MSEAKKPVYVEGERAKRFTIQWWTGGRVAEKLEVRHFDTVEEVLAATKNLGRKYEIFDGRKKVDRALLARGRNSVA